MEQPVCTARIFSRGRRAMWHAPLARWPYPYPKHVHQQADILALDRCLVSAIQAARGLYAPTWTLPAAASSSCPFLSVQVGRCHGAHQSDVYTLSMCALRLVQERT